MRQVEVLEKAWRELASWRYAREFAVNSCAVETAERCASKEGRVEEEARAAEHGMSGQHRTSSSTTSSTSAQASLRSFFRTAGAQGREARGP